MRGDVLVGLLCPWPSYRTVLDWLTEWPGGADYQLRKVPGADGGEVALFTVEPDAAQAVRQALPAVDWLEGTP